MIEVVERMSAKRAEFIAYCKEILSEESLLWVKRLFSNINRKVALEKDDEFAVKVWPMYCNMLSYVRDYVDNPCSGAILMTLYVCGIELGILTMGDEVEGFADFTDCIDMTDWSLVTYQDVVMFDFYCESIIMSRIANSDCDREIVAGGLMAVSVLDYVSQQEQEEA